GNASSNESTRHLPGVVFRASVTSPRFAFTQTLQAVRTLTTARRRENHARHSRKGELLRHMPVAERTRSVSASLSSFFGRQFFDHDVFEPHLRGAAAVDL